MMSGRSIGFTTRASCLLAAGVTAVLCGVVLGETDLVRAGVLAAAIPLAAAVVVHRSRVRIANRRAIEPRQVAAGQAVTVHLTITNRAALPTGALMLEDQLPDRFDGRARFVLDSMSRGEARTVSYRMPELNRGRYRIGPLHVRLNDPFHMIELTRSFTSTTEFLVHPAIDELPSAEPPRSDDLGDGSGSHSIGSHGADDASTREYRTGDDLRKIHWKSSARTGSLMVRQEERPWRSQTTLLLDQRASAHGAGPRQPGRDPASGRQLRVGGQCRGQHRRPGHAPPDVTSACWVTPSTPSRSDSPAAPTSRRIWRRCARSTRPGSTRWPAPCVPRPATPPSSRCWDASNRRPCGCSPTPTPGAARRPHSRCCWTSTAGRVPHPVRLQPTTRRAPRRCSATPGGATVVVSCGMTTPRAWQLLMAGFGATTRTAAAR